MTSDTFAAGIEAAARVAEQFAESPHTGNTDESRFRHEGIVAASRLIAHDLRALTPTDTDTATQAGVCSECGGNGYDRGKMPADEELRGEYDYACHPCGGTGQTAASPKPNTDTQRLAFDGDSLGDHERKGAPYNGYDIHRPDDKGYPWVTDTPVDPGVEGVEIANAAVQANLNANGEPLWDSAQGYACALKAVELTRAALAAKPIAGMT